METVGDFKKAGLVFVEGDVRASKIKNHGNVNMLGDILKGTNTNPSELVLLEPMVSFAWRKSTGVKPAFDGVVEVEFLDGETNIWNTSECTPERWGLDGWGKGNIIKWRPHLKQEIPIETPEEKEAFDRVKTPQELFKEYDKATEESLMKQMNGGVTPSESLPMVSIHAEYYRISKFIAKHNLLLSGEKVSECIIRELSEKHDIDTDKINPSHNIARERSEKLKEIPHIYGKTQPPYPELTPPYTQEMADRGELPLAGCECLIDYPKQESPHHVKYMGVGMCGLHIVSYKSGSIDGIGSKVNFLPLRSDKQKTIDSVYDVMIGEGYNFSKHSLSIMYKNGLLNTENK